VIVQLLWMIVSDALTNRRWCPNSLRVKVLRAFGAQIGNGVLIRHNAKIHWPWKLEIGDYSWLGEEAWILNLENVIHRLKLLHFAASADLHRKPRSLQPHVRIRQWINCDRQLCVGGHPSDRFAWGHRRRRRDNRRPRARDVPVGGTVFAPRSV
jgi:hypothetical protein